MRIGRSAVLLGLVSLTTTACATTTSDTGTSVGGPAGVTTVTEARTLPDGGPLRVRGALVVTQATVEMCDSLAESYPPQCVQGLPLRGFDVRVLPPDTPSVGDVRWQEAITVVVHKADGALTMVDDN